jgi:hypothetical protein
MAQIQAKSSRKSYTTNLKKATLLFYDETKNITETARQFNLKSRSTVREWIKDRENITNPINKNKSRRLRNKDTQKQSLYPQCESELLVKLVSKIDPEVS